MFWQKKEITYDFLIPPIAKPFRKMNSIEAKEYFEWFICIIPQRLKVLTEAFNNQADVDNIKLDYSPNSLEYIWKWFLRVAKVEEITKAKANELLIALKGKPKEYVDMIMKESKMQLSLQTEYILRDIAIYIGEIFIKNNSNIFWGYHTDVTKDSFANMPLLIGFEDPDFNPPFKMEFEPVHMLEVQASKIIDRTASQQDLLLIYRIWEKNIPHIRA